MQIRPIRPAAGGLMLIASATIVFAASLSGPDKQFLILAAKADMTAAHEAQMAETQAQRADVKGLAKRLVQDRTASYEQLTELAIKSGVSIPKGIDAAKDRTIQRLAHLKGSSFDRQYTRDEIASCLLTIATFKQEAAHAKDAGVKAYASRMIPILSKNLKLAEECAKPVAHS
jgi:putative membrane protein